MTESEATLRYYILFSFCANIRSLFYKVQKMSLAKTKSRKFSKFAALIAAAFFVLGILLNSAWFVFAAWFGFAALILYFTPYNKLTGLNGPRMDRMTVGSFEYEFLFPQAKVSPQVHDDTRG